MGTLDSVIFSGSLTKLRIVPHKSAEDMTRSSIIKYFSNNLDSETRKHVLHFQKLHAGGKENRTFE